ncbi:MAG: very short patch repair endonuclease [Gemmatimonadaceae bacterium]|nr:very short patch repair endonuclease [Gemmatimonadaceae bacterium]
MSAIKSRGNRSTEMKLAELLRRVPALKGWRRHAPLAGTPDFTWRKAKLAVFVDGCFWHGCPRCYAKPRKNAEFWAAKVESNRRRDRRVNNELRAAGWTVLRVWECRVSNSGTLGRISRALRASRS